MGIVVLLPYYFSKNFNISAKKSVFGEGKGFEERSMADAGRNRSKKKNQKMCLYIAFPVIAVAIGVASAILLNTM